MPTKTAVLNIAQDYDWCFIDGSPRIEKNTKEIVQCSDLIIIPVQPSPLDFWAVADLVEMIEARQKIADGFPVAAFVINKARAGTRLAREAKSAIEDYSLPTFQSVIHDRIVYAESLIEGKTALESRDDAAKSEIRSLAKEVLEVFR